MPRLTWKKGPARSGLYRLPPTYLLRHNGEVLATVQCELRGKPGAWFWYGDGKNTAENPGDLDAVKENCAAYFKAKLAGEAPSNAR